MSQLRSDFLKTLTFPADQVNTYFEWNYQARELLEDILSVCQCGPEGPWLPEEMKERIQKSVKFWQIVD